MTVWRGGRGVKAPYQTTHVRIPVEIKDQVEKLSKAFKAGSQQETNEFVSFDEAVGIARKILREKKSASHSLAKLLTVIYGEKVDLKELRE